MPQTGGVVPAAGTSLLLSLQAGGFYSAEDADSYPTAESSEKREGAFCVWGAEEIRALLPDPVEGAAEGTTLGDVFMHHYGVKEDGNVSPMQVRECQDLPGTASIAAHGGHQSHPRHTGPTLLGQEVFLERGSQLQDPHQELKGKNVLIIRSSPELTAARFGLEQGRLSALLRDSQHRLRAARAQRPRPHLDTKMLASWNGERGIGGLSTPNVAARLGCGFGLFFFFPVLLSLLPAESSKTLCMAQPARLGCEGMGMGAQDPGLRPLLRQQGEHRWLSVCPSVLQWKIPAGSQLLGLEPELELRRGATCCRQQGFLKPSFCPQAKA